MLVLDRSQPVFDRSKPPESLLDAASSARGLKQRKFDEFSKTDRRALTTLRWQSQISWSRWWYIGN